MGVASARRPRIRIRLRSDRCTSPRARSPGARDALARLGLAGSERTCRRALDGDRALSSFPSASACRGGDSPRRSGASTRTRAREARAEHAGTQRAPPPILGVRAPGGSWHLLPPFGVPAMDERSDAGALHDWSRGVADARLGPSEYGVSGEGDGGARRLPGGEILEGTERFPRKCRVSASAGRSRPRIGCRERRGARLSSRLGGT